MRAKRTQMSPSVRPQCSILFIGPADLNCLNLKAYCHKCIPTFLDENLTAFNEVIVVIDLAMQSGITTVRDLVPAEKITTLTDMSVYSGFNPAIVPVTCLLVHFAHSM